MKSDTSVTHSTVVFSEKAHGKLLFSAEYVVMLGAKALAIPTRYGQELVVNTLPDRDFFEWQVTDFEGKALYSQRFNIDLIPIDLAHVWDKKLQGFLQAFASQYKALVNDKLLGHRFSFNLEFNPQWGLGTSSTLLALLGRYFELDPYLVLDQTIGGSGYDIACAFATEPLTYQLTKQGRAIHPVEFRPEFSQDLHFVYQNKKQHSDMQIQGFDRNRVTDQHLADFTKLTDQIIVAKSIDEYCELLQQHEDTMAKILSRPTLAQQFTDYKGTLKSLGAWGGDFLLAIGEANYTKHYFKSKGYHTIIPWSDMIKQH